MLPTRINSINDQDKHDDWHNQLHEQYNLTRIVHRDEASQLQSILDKFGHVRLGNGIFRIDDTLEIRDNTILEGSTQTTLICNGLVLNPEQKVYARIQLNNLTINNYGSGVTGLDIGYSRVDVKNISVNGFNTGVKIEYGISSVFERLLTSTCATGVLISGDISTTINFSNCTFNDSSLYAVKIEGDINSVSFVDWCVFQSSRYGLYADSCNVVTLVSPYFENIFRENVVIGSEGIVNSFTMINPLMVGGAGNITSTPLTRFDRVSNLTWLGGGDCRIPKTYWIETTANTVNYDIKEPITLGLSDNIFDESKGVIFRRNGRLGQTTYNVGTNWLINSNYFLNPNDLLISDGTDSFVALYADTTTERVNLATKYVSGNWQGGLEVRQYGFVISRQSDNARFLITVNGSGQLEATQL